MARLDNRVLVGGALVAAAGLCFWAGTKKAGGTGMPGTTETHYGDPAPQAPVLQAHEFGGPVMYTKHRYPHVCGQEITTVLHRGWSVADVPRDPQSVWMVRPPSELVL